MPATRYSIGKNLNLLGRNNQQHNEGQRSTVRSKIRIKFGELTKTKNGLLHLATIHFHQTLIYFSMVMVHPVFKPSLISLRCCCSS